MGNIHAVVKNGGVGFISLKEGEGEKEDDRGRWFSYYSKEEFDKELTNSKYQVVDFYTQPISEKTIWLIYTVRVIKKP